MLVFVRLLVVAGSPAYLSFITGLVVGMTLIQVYFHRFSAPVPSEQDAGGAGDADQAHVGRHRSEPATSVAGVRDNDRALLWALYALVTGTFGLFS